MSPTVRIGNDTKRAVNELGGTFDSPDDVFKRLIREAGYGDLLEEEPTHKDKKESQDDSRTDLQLNTNSVKENDEMPAPFYSTVVNWDWPKSIKHGSTKADNVAGVIRRMMAQGSCDEEAYNWAIDHRAEEARREDNSRGEDYEWTVRDSCVRGLGFTGDGATRRFRKECKNLIETYQKEYR